MDNSDMKYRISLIKELAAKQSIVDHPEQYNVSQWELDIMKLGIKACHSIGRIGQLTNDFDIAIEKIKSLKTEIEVLRQYGNKDCTAMADEILNSNPERTKGK